MENGDSANGESPARTLTREDSLYGDAFASPTKGNDSDKIVAIEEDEDSASTATEIEAALHRVKEEKIALEKELEETRRAQMTLATEASRLEGVVVTLQSDLVTSEAATEAAELEANKFKSEADSFSKALQETEGQLKEAQEKFLVEKEKLLGQIEALKEELTETKQHNTSLQVEMGNNHQSAAVSAAQAHQDMAEVLERNAHLEAEISKKTGEEEEGVVVVKEVMSPPNWVGHAVAASTGAMAAVVIMSLYLRMRKQQ